MTAALILGKDVNLTLELCVGMNGTGLCKNLTSFDLCSLNAAEKSTDVVAGLGIVEELAEHFDTCNDCLSLFVCETDDFNFLTELELSALDSACGNCAAACDCEDVFNRHDEGQVCLSFRSRNVRINSIHKLYDGLVLGSVGICGCAFKSLESGTNDDGCVVAGELILVEEFTDFHFDELDKLRIVNLIGLVHVYYNVGNANLTGKKDVLTSLGHGAVCCGNNEDSAVHLSSTGDHVLDIVGMTRAVNVCVVAVVGFVLNVSGVDCDTALSLFGSLIDVCIVDECSLSLEAENLCDSSGQCCLTMVNVTDGTDVYVGLGSFEFLLCHGIILLLYNKKI